MQTHLQKQQLLGRRDGEQLKPVAFSIDRKIKKVMLCSYLREKYQAEVEDRFLAMPTAPISLHGQTRMLFCKSSMH